MVFSRARGCLAGLIVLMSVAACSPQDDKAAKAESVDSASSPSATALEQKTSSEAVPELSLPQRLSEANQTQKAVQGGLLEKVNTTFEAGAVRACLQFRSAVSDAATAGVSNAITLAPEAQGSSVRVEDGQLCVRGLDADRRYAVTVPAGLRLRGGAKTNTPIYAEVFLASLPKAVGFKGGGFVLAKGSARGVQVVSTNVSEVALEMVRVPERSLLNVVQRIQSGESQLSQWDLRSLLEKSAALSWRGRVAIKGQANETVSTIVPIQQAIAKLPAGAYALMVRDASDSKAMMPTNMFAANFDWDYDSKVQVQWLLHTNLATSAAEFKEGMLVSVQSLDQAKPVAAAEVSLVTQNNDIVFKGRTGTDGHVRLPKAAIFGQHANAPSHVLVRHEGDMAWLSVKGPGLDLSAFDIGGRQAPQTLDAYVYTDRGIYRPAETIHVNGLVRSALGKIATVPALNLMVHRPNGSLFLKRSVTLGELASFHDQVALPSEAPRGAWQLTLVSARDDQEVFGRAEVDVQDFVPERLKVIAKASDAPSGVGQHITADVQADFLYGAPASDLGVEAEAVLRAATPSELAALGLEGYWLGDELAAFRAKTLSAEGMRTDARGHSTLDFGQWSPSFAELPAFGVATLPVYAQMQIGVQEPGGRTTKTQARQALAPSQDMVAVRSTFGGEVDTSVSAEFEVRRLSRDLQPVPVGKLRWQLQRSYWSWYYERDDGRWQSNYVLNPKVLAQGDVQADASQPGLGRLAVGAQDWGRYVLTVFDPEGRVYNRQSFYSGWSSNASSSTPDFLEVVATRKQYKPGEDIELGIESPFAGQADVAVWSGGFKQQRTLALDKGRNVLRLETAADWFPGAYVTVTAIRPLADSGKGNPLSADQYMPVRAMGVLYMSADSGRELTVKLPSAEAMSPRRAHEMVIDVPQLAGRTGYAVVQAVDEGILQLTRFTTPSPQGHFFAKRALNASFYDDYNKLLRADGDVGELKTGGDTAVSAGGPSLPVVPTKSVVVYAGPVAVDAKGQARVMLDVPDFNGTLRVMATVWSEDAFGSADRYWVVRDPLVVEAVLPRYIAPGDQSSATLILANTTKDAQSFEVAISSDGVLNVKPDTLKRRLEAGAREQVNVPLSAVHSGTGYLKLAVKSDSGFAVQRQWGVTSRYAGKGFVVHGSPQALAAQQSIAVGLAFAKEHQVKGRTGTIQIREPGLLDASAALGELLRYPWTCSEQTISKAWPVMQAYALDPEYVTREAKRWLGRKTVKAWLQDNVDRILSRQDLTGAIGLWHAGDDLVDPMLSTSLVGFLASSARAGFDVPPGAVASAYEWSHKLALNGRELANAEKVEVLAALVRNIAAYSPRAIRLARALSEEAAIVNPLAQLNVAIALRTLNDGPRAQRLVEQAMAGVAEPSATISYYRTRVAIDAEYAEAFYLLGREQDARAAEERIAQKTRWRYWDLSVREAGQILRLAMARGGSKPIRVDVDGQAYESKLGAISVPIPADVLAGTRARFDVKSSSDRALEVQALVRANPKRDAVMSAEAWGFRVRKQYFDLKGGALPSDLKSVKVSDRIVVLLRAESSKASGQIQTMIKEPIPAGFQVESVITPSQQEIAYTWLPELSSVDVVQVQDDALFAAELRDWSPYSNDELRLAYVLRATTPGQYMPVQTVVEDMYAPTVYGVSAGRSLTVKGNK